MRLTSRNVCSVDGVTSSGLWMTGGTHVRYERSVEYGEPTHERFNNRTHIINLFQPVQVGCKDAGAGAVPAVDHHVAAQKLDQEVIGSGISQDAAQPDWIETCMT